MNEWSKESLEEMFGDNVIEQLAFLSGCTKHSYCNPSHPDLDGYIISHEKLEKFAELIVRECCDIFVELRTRPADLAVKDVKKHFGVEE